MPYIKVNYVNDQPIVKINYEETPVYIKTEVSDVYIKVTTGSTGTVTSVAMTVPTGLTVAGSPIVTSGTLAVSLASGYIIPTQAALDAKVPYSGATGNVDLGEYELKAGQIEFDQSPTGTAGVGVMRWNDTSGTLDLGLKGGNVTMQVGEDMVVRVVNKTNQNLLASNYQVVKIQSAQGQRLAVNFAQANNDNNSADTIGVVAENIANNQEGFIYTVGQITELNTTGSLQGETWVDGDVLYLSPTVAGRMTNVKPVAPQHIVVVGYVEYAHQNHGKIYVKIMNGWELGELHDVNTIGAISGQLLGYNGTIWQPTTRTLTINDVALNLNADRAWSIGDYGTW